MSPWGVQGSFEGSLLDLPRVPQTPHPAPEPGGAREGEAGKDPLHPTQNLNLLSTWIPDLKILPEPTKPTGVRMGRSWGTAEHENSQRKFQKWLHFLGAGLGSCTSAAITVNSSGPG